MPFQIVALSPEPFRHLFGVSDEALAARGVKRRLVGCSPGFPCRITLQDAPAGETVLLLNYEHQPAASPYRSSHVIFVRERGEQAKPAIGELPDALRRRLLSIRAFDDAGMMVAADVAEGRDAAPVIEAMLAEPEVSYLHLHNARQGCYAARADRV